MRTKSIVFAARAKGLFPAMRRARTIISRYGPTPAKMDRALHLFTQILDAFGCGASFPLTAVVLERNRAALAKYLHRNIEFIVHGYSHIDYTQLSSKEQMVHLRLALKIFKDAGIACNGFRSPYLRHDSRLYAAIEEAGFSYVSNQPVMWNVLDMGDLAPSALGGYRRAIEFYEPWYADERPSLPKLGDQLVEVPVSLPDDEILLDRLGGEGDGLVEHAWCRILAESHRRGELFTVQLHPERIAGCADGLSAVLAEARRFTPSVWMARLSEIAEWWCARAEASVEINDVGDGELHLTVAGPSGTSVLARAVQIDAPSVSWADGFQQVKETSFTVYAPLRPFIGLSPTTSPELASFLRQQGYIVEISTESQRYSFYFDQTQFTAGQERSLLAEIEGTDRPLVRLSRWPGGARSALAITGDIDALTIWNYFPFWSGR